VTKILPAFKVDIERLRHWNGMSAAVNKLNIVPRVPRMQSIPLFFVVETLCFFLHKTSNVYLLNCWNKLWNTTGCLLWRLNVVLSLQSKVSLSTFLLPNGNQYGHMLRHSTDTVLYNVYSKTVIKLPRRQAGR